MKKENDEITDLFRTRLACPLMVVTVSLKSITTLRKPLKFTRLRRLMIAFLMHTHHTNV